MLDGAVEETTTVVLDGTIFPGESVETSLTFTVASGATGTLVNWAEILDDNGNDIDSTPGDESQNEDDDDSAQVTLEEPVCTDPVAITITSPANNFSSRAGTILIEGSLEDATATLTMNGVAVSVASDGTFSTNVGLAVGTNTFVFESTSASGCTTTETLTLIRTSGG